MSTTTDKRNKFTDYTYILFTYILLTRFCALNCPKILDRPFLKIINLYFSFLFLFLAFI